jgi:hypothetical protein
MTGKWWLTWCLSNNWLLMLLSFYAKCCQASSTYISALHTSWCHLIFGLWGVSIAMYILVLRVLFSLVAGCDVSWLLQEWDGSCHSGRVWSWAWSFWVILSLMLLLELILVLACIWNKGDFSFKVLCFRYFSTWVVITMLNSNVCWTTCEMDVTCDLLCWITMILACMLIGLKSLVISLDYRSYMGSSMTIWSLRWLFLYLCSYNLGGSMTTVYIQSTQSFMFIPSLRVPTSNGTR